MTAVITTTTPARHTPPRRTTEAWVRDGLQGTVRLGRRLPAAGVLIPLALGAIGHELAPDGLGPFTHAAGGGAMAFIAVLLVCVGAQLTPSSLRPVASRAGLVLLATTVIPGAAAALFIARTGPAGAAGVSALAIAALPCGSNALWIALGRRYGSPADAWGGTVASVVNSLPVLPMLILLAAHPAAGAAVSPAALLDTVFPLALGMAIGAAVPTSRDPLRTALPILLVAVSFALGTRLDLHHLGGQLPAGLTLGLTSALLAGGLCAAGWRYLLHQPATVGWAAAGRTVAMPLTPAILAAATPAYGPLVAAATTQLTIALVVSTLAAPLATALTDRVHRHRTVAPRHLKVAQQQ